MFGKDNEPAVETGGVMGLEPGHEVERQFDAEKAMSAIDNVDEEEGGDDLAKVIVINNKAYTADDIRDLLKQNDELSCGGVSVALDDRTVSYNAEMIQDLIKQVASAERFDDLHVRYRAFVNRGVILNDDTVRERLLLSAVGIGGEAGETIDILKKHVFHGKAIDHAEIVLEMGDMFWYFTLLADTLGISLAEIIDRNMEKLTNRYPEIHNV